MPRLHRSRVNPVGPTHYRRRATSDPNMPNKIRPRGSIILVALAVAMQSVRTNLYLSRPFASRLVLTRNSFSARSEFSDSAENHDGTGIVHIGPRASVRSADDSPVTRSDSKPDDSPVTRSDSKPDDESSESKPDDRQAVIHAVGSSVISSVGTPDAPALIHPVGNAVVSSVGTPDAPALVYPVGNAIIASVGTPDAPALIASVGTPDAPALIYPVGTPKR